MRGRHTIMITMLLCLSGCSGLLVSHQPAEQTFWLESPTRATDTPNPGSGQSIRVRLSARPGLDTDRILVRRAGGRLNYYEGARWPDHSSDVIESLLRLTLESSGAYSRVNGHRDAGAATQSMNMELRRFFAVYRDDSPSPVVQVEIAGYLDCGHTSGPVSSAAEIPARRDTLVEVVQAFQQATDEVLADISSRAIRKCEQPSRDNPT